jgi:hypothetical protein
MTLGGEFCREMPTEGRGPRAKIEDDVKDRALRTANQFGLTLGFLLKVDTSQRSRLSIKRKIGLNDR